MAWVDVQNFFCPSECVDKEEFLKKIIISLQKKNCSILNIEMHCRFLYSFFFFFLF